MINLDAVRVARQRFSSVAITNELGELSGYLLGRFGALALIAQTLLNSRQLDKFAAKVEFWNETYMPGGPPMSPVTDSLFMTWMICDLTVGPDKESLATIVADLVPVLGLPRPLQNDARAYAQSGLGVYRVISCAAHRAILLDLVQQKTIETFLADSWGEPGQLWLARVVQSPDEAGCGFHVLATPYLLLAEEREWLAYFKRVSPDLNVKTLQAHFKQPHAAEFWIDYVMDGYSGVEGALICLEGLPDQPSTLPHSNGAGQDEGSDASALGQLRDFLWHFAKNNGIADESEAFFEDVCQDVGPLSELSKYANDLAQAFQIYGYLLPSGESLIQELVSSGVETSLPDELRRELRALVEGWFSVFEVRLVRIDEGLELYDTLRRKVVFVHERAATRHLASGDALLAHIMCYEDGIYRLEGAIAHVPRLWVEPLVEEVRRIRDIIASKLKKLSWRTRAGLLIPEAVAVYEAMLRNPPLPQLVNFDGEEIMWCEAHYGVLDRQRTVAELNALADTHGSDEWTISGAKAIEAHLRLNGQQLILRCNSRERLKTLRKRLEETLGGAIKWRVDTFQDLESSMREARNKPPSEPAEPIPVDVAEALIEHVSGMMHSWLDERIPLLNNKTPRQAVRSKRGRHQVEELLLGQQQTLLSNPQLKSIDLAFMWDELGLTRPQD